MLPLKQALSTTGFGAKQRLRFLRDAFPCCEHLLQTPKLLEADSFYMPQQHQASRGCASPEDIKVLLDDYKVDSIGMLPHQTARSDKGDIVDPSPSGSIFESWCPTTERLRARPDVG